MMRLKLHNILYITLLLCITSCNNYLNEYTDNRVDLNSNQEISELLTYAYPIGLYQQFTESASDNVVDIGSVQPSIDIINEKAFNFQDLNTRDDRETTTYFWNGCYRAIAYANQAIELINKRGNPSSLNPQKAEALLCRAYAHFLLVNVFGMRYNPATSSSELGVPYVYDVEKNAVKLYKRESVQQNYDKIQKDLLEGLTLVTNDYNQPKFHFNQNAAYAFATRFYLNVGDWNNVIKYADKILATRDLETVAKGYNTDQYQNGDKSYRYEYFGSHTTPQNLLISYVRSRFYTYYRKNRYNLTQALRSELYNSNKIPFEDSSLSWAYRFYADSQTGNRYMAKYNWVFEVTNTINNTGWLYCLYIHFSLDEVLYNRAEAYTMINQYDNAIRDLKASLGRKLNNFDSNRDILTLEKLANIFPPVSNELTPFYENQLNNDKRVLIKAILEYKRLEFMHEGLRWFDIKRYDIIVKHTNIKGDVFILVKNDNRRAFQIPSIAIEYGMKPNPR